jgi:hypothetical protein
LWNSSLYLIKTSICCTHVHTTSFEWCLHGFLHLWWTDLKPFLDSALNPVRSWFHWPDIKDVRPRVGYCKIMQGRTIYHVVPMKGTGVAFAPISCGVAFAPPSVGRRGECNPRVGASVTPAFVWQAQ